MNLISRREFTIVQNLFSFSSCRYDFEFAIDQIMSNALNLIIILVTCTPAARHKAVTTAARHKAVTPGVWHMPCVGGHGCIEDGQAEP